MRSTEIRTYPTLDAYQKMAETALHEKNYDAAIEAIKIMKKYLGPIHYIYRFPNGWGAIIITEKRLEDISPIDSVLFGPHDWSKDPDFHYVSNVNAIAFQEIPQKLEYLEGMPTPSDPN